MGESKVTLRGFVLCGRQSELAEIDSAIQEARDGPAVVVVEGESGIGKSLFLAAALERTRPRAGRTTALSAQLLGGAPLRALEPLLVAYLGVEGGQRVVEPVGLLDKEPVRMSRAELAALIAHRASEIADLVLPVLGRGGDPDVVFVDDLHRFDASSRMVLASILDQALAAASSIRALFVFARWPDVITPADPLEQVLAASGRTRHIVLGPLSEADEADMVRSDVPDAGIGYLTLVRRVSSGSPLRVRAALNVLRQRAVPPTIMASDPRALIALRIPRGGEDDATIRWLEVLDDATRRTLGCVAVFGEEFTVEDARAVVEDDQQLEQQLDSAVDAGVLGSDGLLFWFSHAQLADAAARSTGPAGLARLHERCARRKQQLAASGELGLEVEIARHVRNAGSLVPAAERRAICAKAGELSFAASEWTDAALLIESALAVAGPGLTDDDRLRLGLLAGLSHYYRQDTASATLRLKAAAVLARRLGDERSWCYALVSMARAENAIERGPHDGGADVAPLEDFIAHVDEPVLRAEALVTLAEVHSTMGRVDMATSMAVEALTAAEASKDDRAIAMANFALGFAALTRNEPRVALRAMRLALVRSRRTDDWYTRINLQVRLAQVLIALGSLAEADALATEAVAEAEQRGEHIALSLGLAACCQVAALHGDADRAEHFASLAASAMRRSGYWLALSIALPSVFLLRLGRGDADGLGRLVDEHRTTWAMARHLETLVDLAAGSRLEVDANRRQVVARTSMLSALAAVDAELAVATHDEERLRHLLNELELLDTAGLVFPTLYPVLLSRVHADVLASLGELDLAADRYERALLDARSAEAFVEEARASLGRARVEAARPGGSVDLVRQHCARAVVLATKLGLVRIGEQAAALGRISVDRRSAVEARGGAWCVVLVTDVVGSSKVSGELGDTAYFEVIQRHHALVRACLARHDGREFSDAGDGLYASFRSTEAAVRAALDVRDETTLRSGSGIVELQMKIALAAGEPLWSNERPYGQVVNRAARLVALAGPSQVVVDEAVADQLPADVTAVDRQTVHLRNMGEHLITAIANVSGRA